MQLKLFTLVNQLHAIQWVQARSTGPIQPHSIQQDDGCGGATGREHPQCMGT